MIPWFYIHSLSSIDLNYFYFKNNCNVTNSCKFIVNPTKFGVFQKAIVARTLWHFATATSMDFSLACVSKQRLSKVRHWHLKFTSCKLLIEIRSMPYYASGCFHQFMQVSDQTNLKILVIQALVPAQNPTWNANKLFLKFWWCRFTQLQAVILVLCWLPWGRP